MKKLMMSFMAIIPVVLIAIIVLSSAIIQVSVRIYVERLAFQEQNKVVIKDEQTDMKIDFSAKVYPATATNKKVVYHSSDETVAVPDQEGGLLIKDFGSVTITAISDDNNNITAKAEILVTDTEVHRIDLLNQPEFIRLGDSFVLMPRVIPQEASDKNLIFESSDPSVLFVSQSGYIETRSLGTATIKVTSRANPKVFVEFELSCVTKINSIYADQSKITTAQNDFDLLSNIRFDPNEGEDAVTFESMNPEVATVDEDGRAHFLEAGPVSFKATSYRDQKSCTFEVLYTAGYPVYLAGDDIDIDFTEGQFELKDALNYEPWDLDWNKVRIKSGNSNIAQVDGTMLTLTGGGSTTVIIESSQADGSPILLELTLKVNRKPQDLILKNVDYNDVTGIYERDCVTNTFTLNFEFWTTDSTYRDLEIKVRPGSENYARIVQNQTNLVIQFLANSDNQPFIFDIYAEGIQKTVSLTKIDQAAAIDTGKSIEEIQDKTIELDLDFEYKAELSFADQARFVNVSYTILEGFDVLEVNGHILTPLKGGNALIEATALKLVSSARKMPAGEMSDDFDQDQDIYEEVKFLICIHIIRLAESILVEFGPEFSPVGDTLETVASEIPLFVTVLPEDATTRFAEFKLNEGAEDFCSVDKNGVVRFRAAGQVTIEICVDGISVSKTIKSTYGSLRDYTLDKTSILFEDTTGIETLSLTSFAPVDFDIDAHLMTITSDNESVARVDEQGHIHAVGRGTCYVLVEVAGVVKQIRVEVRAKVKEITPTYGGVSISHKNTILDEFYIGGSGAIGLKISPFDATDPTLLFESLDEEIATVDQNGLVKVLQSGTFTIRIYSQDGGAETLLEFSKIDGIEQLFLTDNEKEVIDTVIRLTQFSANATYRIQLFPADVQDEVNFSELEANILTQSAGWDLNLKLDQNWLSIEFSPSTQNRQAEFEIRLGSVAQTYTVSYRAVTFFELEYDYKVMDQNPVGYKDERVFGIFEGSDLSNPQFSLSLIEMTSLGEPVKDAQGEYQAYLGEQYYHWDKEKHDYIEDIRDGVIYFKSPNEYVYKTGQDDPYTLELLVTDTEDAQYAEVSRTYTYNFVYGINVGTVEALASYFQNAELYAKSNLALVLQASFGTRGQDDVEGLPFVELTAGNASSIVIKFLSDVYGNGYVLNMHRTNRSTGFTMVGLKDEKFDRPMVIDNLWLKTASNDARGNWTQIYFYDSYQGVTLQYCDISNGLRTIGVQTSKMTIKNCSIHDMREDAIRLNDKAVQEVFLEDVLIYNVETVAINYMKTGRAPKIYIKGFLDVYNYRTANDLSGLNLDGYESLIENIISKYDHLYSKFNDDEYLNIITFAYDITVGVMPMMAYYWFDEELDDYVKMEKKKNNETPYGIMYLEETKAFVAKGCILTNDSNMHEWKMDDDGVYRPQINRNMYRERD